ncbi:MAG: hypothetical protein D6731_26070 [Planctomycetota bacterium]|nr:MAG: hypothetical protein D6731_26070 [Planctomycetota bacterium]
MNRFASFFCCALLLPLPLLAQDPPPPGPRRRGFGGMGKLAEELGLSEEQRAQFDAFRQEMRERMRELRESGDRRAMREAMRTMRQEMQGKIESILTPEQKETFARLREERRKRMEEWRGRRGRRGDRRASPEQLKSEALRALKLGEEAAAVVTPLLDAVVQARSALGTLEREQRRALREKAEGDVAAEELTKALEDYRAARKEAQAKLAEARGALREVLTLRQEVALVALGLLD